VFSSCYFLEYWKGKDKSIGHGIQLKGEANKWTVLHHLKETLKNNNKAYKIYIHFNGHGSLSDNGTEECGAWMCADG
jgi:hypothetical protein